MTIDGKQVRDLHRLVLEVFRQPGYVGWYIICLIAVGLHLSHGFYSSFSSLGLYHPRYAPWVNRIGYGYAAIVAIGFISQPAYVFLFASR
jgi:succinate dehydrogenase / fumarate reductase cytochrome b subunit